MKKKLKTKRKAKPQPTVAFSVADNARILHLEGEILRLRSLIDQHEKEAEARYHGRARTAEQLAAMEKGRADQERQQHDVLKAQVSDVLTPLKPLYLLMKALWMTDAERFD